MKLPVHPESTTEDFFFLECVFVVGARARILHTYVF